MSAQGKHGESRPAKGLERVQTLIGRAISAYYNDRAVDRASAVIEPLTEALDICVELRSKRKARA